MTGELEAEVAAYEAELAANPRDLRSSLALAETYGRLGRPGERAAAALGRGA